MTRYTLDGAVQQNTFDASNEVGGALEDVGFDRRDTDPGRKMYLVDLAGEIYEYDLDLLSLYDITTASYTGRSLASNLNQPVGIQYADPSPYNVVDQADISVKDFQPDNLWNIAPATFEGELSTSNQTNDPSGIAWDGSGDRLYVSNSNDGTIYVYETSLYNARFGSFSGTSVDIGTGAVDDIAWSEDGAAFYASSGDTITEFEAATPYDLTTLSQVTTYTAFAPVRGLTTGDFPNKESPQPPLGLKVYGAFGDTKVRSYGQSIIAEPTTDTITATTPLPTLTPAVTNWYLGSDEIGESVAEQRTDATLSLTRRVTTNTLDTALRPLKSDEGKVDILSQDDGGFVAVDRADGGNTFIVIPPERRRPLRDARKVHVDRYDEDLVSQEVREWDVEIAFIVSQNREDAPSISETPASDEWGFSTPLGTIATSRVDADVLGTGRDGVKRFELTARFTLDQAHVWEAAFDRIRGTRVKEIPDASNVMVDETGGDATVTVEAPDGQDAVSDGDYVVTEWESVRITDAYQTLSFVLAET
jgi:DNA-binding beta-propeller fold protein YncE